jgi:hypothetical protein
MRTRISQGVRAPIEEVFAFFDEPANTLGSHPHAERVEIVDETLDGRRTYDVLMRSDTARWTQTVEQVLREPPTRLVTRGGSWSSDRRQWLLTVSTDRRFSADGEVTRVDVLIETRVERPLRRPLHAIRSWLGRGSARREYRRQLTHIAERIEARRPA